MAPVIQHQVLHQNDEQSSSTCRKLLRFLPSGISLGCYVTCTLGAVWAVYDRYKNDLVKVDSDLCLTQVGLAYALGNVGISAIITGIEAVKELCASGLTGAKEVLYTSVLPRGLLHDTVFPDILRMREILNPEQALQGEINDDDPI